MISGIEYIGIRLRQSRMQKGLSQAKLGQLSSTNQGVIQKIENGASLHPTKIMEIAEVLDVNPAWLQFGEPWAQKERPGSDPRPANDLDRNRVQPRGPVGKPPSGNGTTDVNFTAWLKLADQSERRLFYVAVTRVLNPLRRTTRNAQA